MVQITYPVFMVLYKVDVCGWCRSLTLFSWSCTKWMCVDGADHLHCFHGPVQSGCVWMVQITYQFSWSCTKWMSVDGADHLPSFHGPVQSG